MQILAQILISAGIRDWPSLFLCIMNYNINSSLRVRVGTHIIYI